MGKSQNKRATVLMKEFGKEWSELSNTHRIPFNKLAEEGKHIHIILSKY